MTGQEIMDGVRRELIISERYGSRLYPCAVALTEDQKCEFLSWSTGTAEVRFSATGDLRLWGLPVAIVPDSWKGPLVLLGAKP